MTEDLETIDSTNDDELEVIDSETNEDEAVEEERTDYSEYEKKLFNRVKTLEKKLEDKAQPVAKPVSDAQFSLRDSVALQNANISVTEDFDEVELYASQRNMSITDALNDVGLKAILASKLEQRETANATNIKGSQKSNSPQSDSVIIANANRGKIPEDDAGIAALVAAKRKL